MPRAIRIVSKIKLNPSTFPLTNSNLNFVWHFSSLLDMDYFEEGEDRGKAPEDRMYKETY